MSRLDAIRSPKLRAIITGSATPASDIQGQWPHLDDQEQWDALAYFGSVSTLREHAEAESTFCKNNDL